MKLTEITAGDLPQLIMYDLDGTLVDSVPDLAISIDAMLDDLNLPKAGEDKVRLWVGNGIPSLVKRALVDDMAGDQPGIVNREVFVKAYDSFKHHYAIEVGQHSHLYPGVKDFLQAMADKGVKQAVVTNKSEIFTEKLLKLMGIDHFFEISLGGDSLDEQKPHPLPLLHAIEKAEASLDTALMIGDSSNDIKAARAAGVKVIALPYGYNHGEPIAASNPDLIVTTLDKLL
ncbi:phosphoglycolate phosphatase [Endozoicomonas gorgoniicola]|uniref:Phosphoglycolate phosphatase n=1 Tax=Endozoicomonas gorgoniicola TaxID=1234144 RepID=A0ABT3MPB3_9GAMM|nr:phosphoglycolate phosphatase [Endozoicomonas gorgoniicola]MCW7551213.1 phosphoglycolate phosphatase [Endozoicomonas gorgoniicola]